MIPIVLALASIGHAGELPGGVSWGDPVADVQEAMAARCKQVRMVEVRPPRLPVAERTEHHVICHEFSSDAGSVEAIAFAFGDNKLVLIEARGGAVDAFGAGNGDNVADYLHYTVVDSERFLVSRDDTAWFASEAALHPHLFTWPNPFLDQASDKAPAYRQSAARPAALNFGNTLAALLPGFEESCAFFVVEEIGDVWLPHEPASQTQVNCLGLEYAGFPRKVEAVFGDDTLEVAWILTARPEEDRVRQLLVAEFGPPEMINATWEVFANGRVALRKDITEVLMISERMVPYYRTYYGQD